MTLDTAILEHDTVPQSYERADADDVGAFVNPSGYSQASKFELRLAGAYDDPVARPGDT